MGVRLCHNYALAFNIIIHSILKILMVFIIIITENLNTCAVMLSGPSWIVSSTDAKFMNSVYPYQVRFSVVMGGQEILSPLVPLSGAKKSVRKRPPYTYLKPFLPWVLFRGLLYLPF